MKLFIYNLTGGYVYMKRMKLTRSKLNRIIHEEKQKVLYEMAHGRPYEDDALFQHGVDEEYGDMGAPGDISSPIDVKDIPSYLEDMGYMIVPIEDFQMGDDESMDYEAAAAKQPYYNEEGDFTGGMGGR